MQKALVHIRCNTGKVRRETRNGRDIMIVPSFTLKSGIVMNRIKYERDEIDKAFASFERSPAPLGHPTVNGKFVSAKDPEGLARSWAASWNENVRRDGDRIAIDKVIDVDQAKQLDAGKAILAAIENGAPIHSSTGLLCMLEPVTNNADYDYIARDMIGDHDAWLLNEPGAATPDDGVGILVNAAAEAGEGAVAVINSSLEDSVDQEIDWAVDSLVRAVERKKQLPLLERMKMSIMAAIRGDTTPETTEGVALNAEQDDMDKAQFDALSAKVDALVAAPAITEAKIAEIVGNALKPVIDAQDAITVANKAKEAADHADLVAKVVANGLLDEAVAKEAATPVLNALLAKTPATALRVVGNSAYRPATGNDRAPLALKGE